MPAVRFPRRQRQLMLLLLEEHRVIGRKKTEFENRYREGALGFANDPDFRLIWYFDIAHGTGPSYRVITGTALPSGEAWERFIRRAENGDVRDWLVELDELRYSVDGRVLSGVPWLTMEDPFATPSDLAPKDGKYLYWMTCIFPNVRSLEDYTEEFAHKRWYEQEQGVVYGGIARIDGIFISSWGAGRWPEAVLIEKIANPERLKMLLTENDEMQFDRRRENLAVGLQFRHVWTTTLLRTSNWSPWGV
jgi:hypothetical protein